MQVGIRERLAQPSRQPVSHDHRIHAGHFRLRQIAEALRQPRSGTHAHRHRLTMQVVAIARHLLDRMAESVSQIEQRTTALLGELALIGLDNLGLDLTATPHRFRQLRTRDGQRMLFQPGKQRRIAEQAVLDDLRHAGGKLARRQRGQQPGRDEDRPRLVEGAHEVFAGLEINPGFPAHGAVHHREQRRRHLHKIDATLVGRCRKAAEVAHHTAAHGKEHARAVEPVLCQKIEHTAKLLQALRLLAGLQGEHRRRVAKHRAQRPALARLKICVGDDGKLAPYRRQLADKRTHLGGKIRAKVNRITALAEVDGQSRGHGAR